MPPGNDGLDTVQQCLDEDPSACWNAFALFSITRITPVRSSQAPASSVSAAEISYSSDLAPRRSQLVEFPQEGEVADLVGRQLHVGGAQDERLIALVPAPLQERAPLRRRSGPR